MGEKRLKSKFQGLATLLLLFLFALTCAGTSGCGLARECLSGAEPGPESLPVRDVATVVVVDETANREGVKALLGEAREIFYEQTGVRLVFKDWLTIRWKSSSRSGTLQELADVMKTYQEPFDLAIGYYEMGPLDLLVFNTFGGWQGVIDDNYRRFVVIRRDNLHVVMHELGHAFLFKHLHSAGVMSAYSLCLVGDHMCNNYEVCFSDSERREIAHNKWRDFGRQPDLPEREDQIKYTYSKTPLQLLIDLFKLPFTIWSDRTDGDRLHAK